MDKSDMTKITKGGQMKDKLIQITPEKQMNLSGIQKIQNFPHNTLSSKLILVLLIIIKLIIQ